MTALGFDNYQEAGRVYLAKYRNVSHLTSRPPLDRADQILMDLRLFDSTSTNIPTDPHITNEQSPLPPRPRIEIRPFKRQP